MWAAENVAQRGKKGRGDGACQQVRGSDPETLGSCSVQGSDNGLEDELTRSADEIQKQGRV